MTENTIFDELERSNNILSSAISHLEIAKSLIDNGISKLDSSMLDDLPINEINRLAEEYINNVRFVQNRLSSIVAANTLAVYASPDILSGKNNINWR